MSEAEKGWLPIVLCPTDGVERALLLPDGTETRGCFRNPPGRWRVWLASHPMPPHKLEPVGGVERQSAPYATAVYGDLREGVYPTHFRPNDTVYGPAGRAALEQSQ